MSAFYDSIYRAVGQIPKGKVATYGQIALYCGNSCASRAVGWALHQNPSPGVIPCHRVVNREGRMAPAFAFGGPEIQRGLLQQEGVPFLPDGRVDLSRALWENKG